MKAVLQGVRRIKWEQIQRLSRVSTKETLPLKVGNNISGYKRFYTSKKGVFTVWSLCID
jgi:hypothetical protein